MAMSAALEEQDIPPLLACTVARDVQKFDLLIEDMEAELGEAWGDLGFEDAQLFFAQPEAKKLKFVAIAIDDQDEENLALIADVITSGEKAGLKIILIAEEVSPIALHQLLKLGAREFVPYPLPEGALHEAVVRLEKPAAPANDAAAPRTARRAPGEPANGTIVAVHSLAGGAGATTLASNLAWELVQSSKDEPPTVCLLDLDLQTGSTATYLDLPRRDAVYELLSDIPSMDRDSFMQALQTYDEKLKVLTAPAEMLPLDLLDQNDVKRLLEVARANFDYVVIDLPRTVVQWTETVLNEAHVFFSVMELDMRSAQNTLRLLRALRAEDLPTAKLRFVLNRAPKFTDLSAKARVKRMAESLDISIAIQLPDGGKAVMQACDHGLPLSEAAPKNPLRKEIQKLATMVLEHEEEDDKAAEL